MEDETPLPIAPPRKKRNKKICKEDISPPTNFRHLQHVGPDFNPIDVRNAILKTPTPVNSPSSSNSSHERTTNPTFDAPMEEAPLYEMPIKAKHTKSRTVTPADRDTTKSEEDVAVHYENKPTTHNYQNLDKCHRPPRSKKDHPPPPPPRSSKPHIVNFRTASSDEKPQIEEVTPEENNTRLRISAPKPISILIDRPMVLGEMTLGLDDPIPLTPNSCEESSTTVVNSGSKQSSPRYISKTQEEDKSSSKELEKYETPVLQQEKNIGEISVCEDEFIAWVGQMSLEEKQRMNTIWAAVTGGQKPPENAGQLQHAIHEYEDYKRAVRLEKEREKLEATENMKKELEMEQTPSIGGISDKRLLKLAEPIHSIVDSSELVPEEVAPVATATTESDEPEEPLRPRRVAPNPPQPLKNLIAQLKTQQRSKSDEHEVKEKTIEPWSTHDDIENKVESVDIPPASISTTQDHVITPPVPKPRQRTLKSPDDPVIAHQPQQPQQPQQQQQHQQQQQVPITRKTSRATLLSRVEEERESIEMSSKSEETSGDSAVESDEENFSIRF